MIKLTGQFSVHVPHTANYAKNLNTLRQVLCQVCSGCNAVESQGSWVNDQGETITEPITIVTARHDRSTLVESQLDVIQKSLVAILRLDGEKCVGIERDGVFLILD